MTATADPVDRIDLALAPLTYPGPRAAGSVLVLPECQHTVTLLPGQPPGAAGVIRCRSCAARYGRRVVTLDDELRARGAAPIGLRTPVVAVGANASAGVVRGKLHRGGADEVIPLLRRRGLFRTAYSGETLREHYGLASPRSGFTEAAHREI